MVQDLMTSMIRFSAATAMFGQQQVQHAMSYAMKGDPGMKTMVEALDSATEVLSGYVKDGQKKTLKSMTDMGSDFVNRTFDSMKVVRMDPQHIMETTGNMVRQVTEIMDNAINKTADVAKAAATGEPKAAADTLKG